MMKKSYLIKEIGASFGDAPFGTALKSKDYTSEGIPVIQGQNIVDQVFEWNRKLYTSEEKFKSLKRSHCNAGDLVFPKIGNRTVGSCAIAPTIEGHSTYLLSTNMMKMSVNPELADIKYVYYFFCQPSIRQKIISQAGGGAQPIFNFTSLKNFEIELPPLPVQRKIADVLSSYDDLIEVNTRRIRILEQMAQSVYREWFGKVDEKSLPEAWEIVKLGDVADIQWGDTSVTKASYVNEGFTAYSASGADGKLEYFDFDRKGIVLSAIGANCGKTWFARGKWSCIKNTIRFWSKSSRVSDEYLYLTTANENFWTKRGAAQPFISQGDARGIKILCPPQSLMDEFTKFTADALEQIDVLQRKNTSLRRTRDLLLPRLVSGEVSVDGLEVKETGDVNAH